MNTSITDMRRRMREILKALDRNQGIPQRQGTMQMNRRGDAFTLIELLVIVIVLGILFTLLVPALAWAREEIRKKSCAENLSPIGCAVYAYTQGSSEFYPFAWGPATGSGSPCVNPATGAFTPGVPATTACCDAATSIGCLYPQHVPTAKIFRCPSTRDAPSLLMTAPCLPGTNTPATPANGYLYSQCTWSLAGSSYGYDCRIYPSALSTLAIAGDMPGSWQGNRLVALPNHADGQNVLYVDGSVRWKTTNYASSDPMDNIYSEGGEAAPGAARDYWCADTDSFLVRGSVVLGPSWNDYPQIQQ